MNYPEIIKLLSKQRFQPYLEAKNSVEPAYNQYLYNIKLCESFYPSLNLLEIGLRNSINNLFTEKFTENWLLQTGEQSILSFNEQRDVEKAIDSLKKRGIKTDIGNIVAELNFGFWNALFNKHYDTKLWQKPNFIKSVFPNLPREHRSAKFIRDEIKIIRVLRNRIFHHEPIWNSKVPPKDIHAKICYFIKSISSELEEAREQVDDFEKVNSKK
jgi:hypothetical protein